ncbi:cuticle protein 16.8-like [Ixodes scapularis]|uniref:cuticle protein 16.8-like n=1 Tax=Ixodes scapularis TaxID=6945 RepID=UPI001A9FCD44|nr:cuticle protein 16.8-like [Ixodes scapularis]
MFSKVLVCCLFAYVACGVVVENVHVPQPYSFGYDNVDEFGTRLTRQETGDEFNNKVGSYGYVDAHGVARTVNYVADALGFRATVQTNEPGTKTSAPADAPTYSSSVEVAAPVVVKAVHPAPVVVKTVHPAPVVVKAVHPAPVVVKAVHPAPVVVKAVHPAPVAYTHRVAPLAYSTVAHANLGYTLGHTTVV